MSREPDQYVKFTCDQCGKVERVVHTGVVTGCALPQDWLHVKFTQRSLEGLNADEQEVWKDVVCQDDFCSRDCVASYVREAIFV